MPPGNSSSTTGCILVPAEREGGRERERERGREGERERAREGRRERERPSAKHGRLANAHEHRITLPSASPDV